MLTVKNKVGGRAYRLYRISTVLVSEHVDAEVCEGIECLVHQSVDELVSFEVVQQYYYNKD